MRWPAALGAALVVAVPCLGSAQVGAPFDLMRPPTQERSVVTTRAIPPWLALPSTARVLTSAGLSMRPLRNAAVSYENIALGVLVGALRNTGRCASDVRVFLQYTDERWQPLGERIESEARVSEVAPDGTLPYRFRLRRRDAFPTPPSAYILQVVDGEAPVASTLEWVSTTTAPAATPCPSRPVRTTAAITKGRGTLSGYRVDGTLTVDAGGSLRVDAVTLTALLLDRAGDVLEVLVGVPTADAKRQPDGLIAIGQRLPFRLTTAVPLGNDVATHVVFVDVLPDASVAR